MTATNWMHDLMAAVDHGGVRGMHDFLDQQVKFRFGSFPPAQGRDTFAAAWDAMSANVASMSHTLLETWQLGDTGIMRGDVTYHLRHGAPITVPFVNVLKRRGERIVEYYIYVDASAVFGPSSPASPS